MTLKQPGKIALHKDYKLPLDELMCLYGGTEPFDLRIQDIDLMGGSGCALSR